MAQSNQPQLNPQQQEFSNSKTPPKDKKNKQMSTQSHLQFSEIKDGIVVMRDGSLRMIIICSPTNFDLKSPAEKDAIEFAYQGFLNGLHFPIQIVIQSRKIDLDGYLAKLDNIQSNQSNPLLASLMEDYVFNIKGLLDEVNIMEKRFYVVVPYYTNVVSKENILTKLKKVNTDNVEFTQTTTEYETRKKDLIQRTQLVAQGLAQVGVRAAVLNTQEVIELFYNSYNIAESQNQTLTNISDVSAPIVTRQGGLPQMPRPLSKEAPPDDLYSAANRQAASQRPVPNSAQNPANINNQMNPTMNQGARPGGMQ
ncbi:MAG: hypothetical protein QG675_82 [Patescibacteria group bacterium]|jgi:hypothetical protein|nr:hypothetical protein [Patescibacteria group bacterium]